VVQGLLSWQLGPSSSVNRQPTKGAQNSVVQGLWSLQSIGGPLTHEPKLHWSGAVHGFPSLQGAVLKLPEQKPKLQLSGPVQGFPSLHGAVLLVPAHDPNVHWSLLVHALLSSHGVLLKTTKQPLAELQRSSVQGLPSSQTIGTPPPHTPPEHVVPTMQASPLRQGSVLSACAQTNAPPAELQMSVVQTLPSSQTGWHVAVQQEPGVPFAAPSSHCSPPPVTPSPQTAHVKSRELAMSRAPSVPAFQKSLLASLDGG
jgi:hypothetical protein